MTSKSFILLLITLLLSSCGDLSEPSQQMSLAQIKSNGEGSITLAYVPSDGFSYEDESGNLTGVTIEIVRDFAAFAEDQHGVEIEIHYMPIDRFGAFYDFVQQSEGGVFGVANVTITEERKQELAFSPSYMRNIATLITHSDTPYINSFDEIPEKFEGLNALAFEGTLHEERLRTIVEDHIPQALIHFAQSNNEIIERVAESDEYFAYVDIYNYWRAAELDLPLRRHEEGDVASEEFGIILPLNSDWHELLVRFFEADGGYVQSERYRQLMSAHLGNELAELLLSQMN